MRGFKYFEDRNPDFLWSRYVIVQGKDCLMPRHRWHTLKAS